MDINNLYEVQIECLGATSTTGVIPDNFSSLNYIPIDYFVYFKISLIDFNGQSVVGELATQGVVLSSNKKIHIKCDKGNLANILVDDGIPASGQLRWTSINAQEYDAGINSKGYTIIVYKASEWGLCTISADVNKTQLFVKGFKDMPLSKTPNNPSVFQVDESIRACRLKYTVPAMTPTSTLTLLDNGIIPTKYVPFSNCNQVHFRGDIGLVLTSSNGTANNVSYNKGSILTRSGTNTSSSASSQTALIEWRY